MELITSESQEEIDNLEERKNLKKIEAALFLSARYLSVNELVELTDINPLLLRELLEKLREIYITRDSAVEILNKEDLWKMDIKQEYFNMINKIATGNAEFTKAEQETLAIIAYKQPVKQSVMIKIRGNKAYEHVKHFIEIGLVKSKRLGHTLELSLTEGFYDYFHLEKKVKEDIEKEIAENNGGEEVTHSSEKGES
jgi:segregation and condensation protein B